MTDDEILQLASETSGAHSFDHAHVIRFARAVIDRATTAERDVMEQALDALDSCHAADPYSSGSNAKFDEDAVKQAATALRKALGERDE